MTDRHFYSPLHAADALLPRSGSINWAERRHHAVIDETRGARLGLLIFWSVIAVLLLARVALVSPDAPRAEEAAHATPVSQTASPPPAKP